MKKLLFIVAAIVYFPFGVIIALSKNYKYGADHMTKHKIKTATACYTGGGIYIYYGQLESGLYFRAWDECEAAYICDTKTDTEEAEYAEFYEQHTLEELTEEAFDAFWNQMLSHVIKGGPAYDKWSNYLKSDLEERIIK